MGIVDINKTKHNKPKQTSMGYMVYYKLKPYYKMPSAKEAIIVYNSSRDFCCQSQLNEFIALEYWQDMQCISMG